MTPAEIEAVLRAAFAECDVAFCSLTQKQKQILLQVVFEQLNQNPIATRAVLDQQADTTNPLDELTPEQRGALLEFVKEQERQNCSWKIQLLNDWLENRNSGAVQFIRDRYGLQWLDRIGSVHLAEYYDRRDEEGLKIKVGDRIEVSNSLWEWVQETGPCPREWFPCIVVGIYETDESDDSYTSCIIRFADGIEYEIQGIYQWNRYNWRWNSA